ncbi:MAG: acetolactate decarboxylase [Bacillota bacterium]|nr:acetolactate decarboxylase [Bacillota bacterium]
MSNNQLYQVSTLQALLLGYTKGVVSIEHLLEHGDIGLGTFSDADGEMIVIDHKVYRARQDGSVVEVEMDENSSFASVADFNNAIEFEIDGGSSIEDLKKQLDVFVDEDFGINSIYVVRLDGFFEFVKARSLKGHCSHHIELSKILEKNQRNFSFEKVKGSLVCLYFPDYMQSINAAGWHFHFISEDRKQGGHVYNLAYSPMIGKRKQIHNIQIQIPTDVAFDTYPLTTVSQKEVKKVEQ